MVKNRYRKTNYPYAGCRAVMCIKDQRVQGLRPRLIEPDGLDSDGFYYYSVSWDCDPQLATQVTHLEIIDDVGCIGHAMVVPPKGDINPAAEGLSFRFRMKLDPALGHGEYQIKGRGPVLKCPDVRS